MEFLVEGLDPSTNYTAYTVQSGTKVGGPIFFVTKSGQSWLRLLHRIMIYRLRSFFPMSSCSLAAILSFDILCGSAPRPALALSCLRRYEPPKRPHNHTARVLNKFHNDTVYVPVRKGHVLPALDLRGLPACVS